MDDVVAEPAKDPIPLIDPQGVVRAWACGACDTVKNGVEYYGEDRVQRIERFSHERAVDCCRCRQCGGLKRKFSEASVWFMCEACWAGEAGGRVRHAMAAAKAENEEKDRARDASVDKALDRAAAWSLRDLMSELSEEFYCAGWLNTCDRDLWAMVQGGDRQWGMGEVTPDDVAELRRLSEVAGGWWIYEVFLPLDDWMLRYEAKG